MHSPLEQFEIHRLIHLNLGGFDASFTNASLFMVIVSVLVTMLLTLPMRRGDDGAGPLAVGGRDVSTSSSPAC